MVLNDDEPGNPLKTSLLTTSVAKDMNYQIAVDAVGAGGSVELTVGLNDVAATLLPTLVVSRLVFRGLPGSSSFSATRESAPIAVPV